MAYVLTSEFLNEEDLMSLRKRILGKIVVENLKILGVERQRLGLWKPIGRSKFRFSSI
ncbi:10672_t:CDS:2 [Funneliformis caledonium]|uniref:10672_t:CDS:1 n=1 Tax=Funneliformis caledonium TaxID=1117310 RepID=A0A9N9EVI8_9GLOM|nr:10672_t:CDS:2 [Funneliformis caledonium]